MLLRIEDYGAGCKAMVKHEAGEDAPAIFFMDVEWCGEYGASIIPVTSLASHFLCLRDRS